MTASDPNEAHTIVKMKWNKFQFSLISTRHHSNDFDDDNDGDDDGNERASNCPNDDAQDMNRRIKFYAIYIYSREETKSTDEGKKGAPFDPNMAHNLVKQETRRK